MNANRLMAMAVTTCAADLSLAACTAGITTASPVTSRSPATSRTASLLAVASSTSSADAVSVDATIGRFPIPHKAKVLYNSTYDKQILIELSSVTPSQALSFYVSAMHRAGYKITGNSLLANTGDGLPGSAAQIEFTGHGYDGTITAVSDLGALSSMGPSPAVVPSRIAKIFFTIRLAPPDEDRCAVSTAP